MEENSTGQNSPLLSSWKEIAAYLGVSVRTAQKWEVERGLPVQRVPGGRGRVLVTVDALNAWLHAPGTPAVKPEPAEPPGRRRPLRTIAVALGIVLLLAAGGAAWISWNAQPHDWRVEGDFLVALDDHNREIWRTSFGFPLRDYREFAKEGLNAGWVGDLDGDGSSEVLFIVGPKEHGAAMVVCFSHRGRERWRFIPGASAARFGPNDRPPYTPLNLALVHLGGVRKIAVASVHHTNSAANIALLSSSGKLEREYWHNGYIQFLAVADLAGSGKPLLYAAGVANGFNQAVLVVLDPDNFGGTSRESDPRFQLPGPPPREVARVLFPRSCINLARTDYNVARGMHAREDGFEVGVWEEWDQPEVVIHSFDPNGRYRGATLSSSFAARHTELEHTKFLTHKLDRVKEAAALSHITWLTGDRIVRPNQ